jgi:hypothetical protein
MTLTICTKYQEDGEQYWYAQKENGKYFALSSLPILYSFISKEFIRVEYIFTSLEKLK